MFLESKIDQPCIFNVMMTHKEEIFILFKFLSEKFESYDTENVNKGDQQFFLSMIQIIRHVNLYQRLQNLLCSNKHFHIFKFFVLKKS